MGCFIHQHLHVIAALKHGHVHCAFEKRTKSMQPIKLLKHPIIFQS